MDVVILAQWFASLMLMPFDRFSAFVAAVCSSWRCLWMWAVALWRWTAALTRIACAPCSLPLRASWPALRPCVRPSSSFSNPSSANSSFFEVWLTSLLQLQLQLVPLAFGLNVMLLQIVMDSSLCVQSPDWVRRPRWCSSSDGSRWLCWVRSPSRLPSWKSSACEHSMCILSWNLRRLTVHF